VRDHFAHLTVHGTLHLIGYDHENERDAEHVEAIERRVLAQLGVPNPYE
jgi:probable rRNA maturation factor